MSVTRSHTSYVVRINKHILLRLEGLMHVVYLSVWSNCCPSSLRYNFLFVNKLSTAWSNWSPPTGWCFLISTRVALIDAVAEGATSHIISWVSIHSRLILSLTRKLIVVISTVCRWILLSKHIVTVLANCTLNIIIILRSIETTVALLSVLLGGGWYLILHAYGLILLAHAFDVFSNDVIFAHHWLLLLGMCITLLASQGTTFAS